MLDARTVVEMDLGLFKRKYVQCVIFYNSQKAEPGVIWMKHTWIDLSLDFFDADCVLFDVQAMQLNTNQCRYSMQKSQN